MTDKLFKLKMDQYSDVRIISEPSDYFSIDQKDDEVIVELNNEYDIYIKYHSAVFENVNRICVFDDITQIIDNESNVLSEIDTSKYILSLSYEETIKHNHDEDNQYNDESIILRLEDYPLPKYITDYNEGRITKPTDIVIPQTSIDVKYNEDIYSYIGTLYMRTSIQDLIPLRVVSYISNDLRHLLSKLNCDIYTMNYTNIEILGDLRYIVLNKNNRLDLYLAIKTEDILKIQSVISGDMMTIEYSQLLNPDNGIIGKVFMIPETSIIVYGESSNINEYIKQQDEDIDEEQEDKLSVDDAASMIYSTYLIDEEDFDDLKKAVMEASFILYKNKDNIDEMPEDDKDRIKDLIVSIDDIREKDNNYFDDIIIMDEQYIYSMSNFIYNFL